ncbi:MAG: YciI family protein [Bacteroidota bacterium]
MYYALIYHNHPSYMSERGKYREEHLGLLNTFVNSGELSLAGAFDDPDRSLYVFRGVQAEQAAQNFVAQDPYVTNKLVNKWEIKKWNVVIGVDMES